MYIDNKISKRNIADFELALNKYRLALLRSIWEKHLRDKIEFQVFHGEKVQICREQFEGFKYNVVELTHSVVSHELCPR